MTKCPESKPPPTRRGRARGGCDAERRPRERIATDLAGTREECEYPNRPVEREFSENSVEGRRTRNHQKRGDRPLLLYVVRYVFMVMSKV